MKLEKVNVIEGREKIDRIFADPAFSSFMEINVLPLIYDERNQRCNILVFDYEAARKQTVKIVHSEEGSGRKHPVPSGMRLEFGMAYSRVT